MSKQNDDLKLREQAQLAIYDEFCWVCGEELYTGDPPQEGYCTNPKCPECDRNTLEEYEGGED